MRLDRVEIQPFPVAYGMVGGAHVWRWHKRAPNGKILCQGESHPDANKAARAARRANLGCDYELSVRDVNHRITHLEQTIDGKTQVLA